MCLTGSASFVKYTTSLSAKEKAVVRNELRTALGALVRAENVILKGHKNRHSLMVVDGPVSLWQQLKQLQEKFEI
jgi:hypothetical protein